MWPWVRKGNTRERSCSAHALPFNPVSPIYPHNLSGPHFALENRGTAGSCLLSGYLGQPRGSNEEPAQWCSFLTHTLTHSHAGLQAVSAMPRAGSQGPSVLWCLNLTRLNVNRTVAFLSHSCFHCMCPKNTCHVPPGLDPSHSPTPMPCKALESICKEQVSIPGFSHILPF